MCVKEIESRIGSVRGKGVEGQAVWAAPVGITTLKKKRTEKDREEGRGGGELIKKRRGSLREIWEGGERERETVCVWEGERADVAGVNTKVLNSRIGSGRAQGVEGEAGWAASAGITTLKTRSNEKERVEGWGETDEEEKRQRVWEKCTRREIMCVREGESRRGGSEYKTPE